MSELSVLNLSCVAALAPHVLRHAPIYECLHMRLHRLKVFRRPTAAALDVHVYIASAGAARAAAARTDVAAGSEVGHLASVDRLQQAAISRGARSVHDKFAVG